MILDRLWDITANKDQQKNRDGERRNTVVNGSRASAAFQSERKPLYRSGFASLWMAATTADIPYRRSAARLSSKTTTCGNGYATPTARNLPPT
jgi:hypothetical protein